MVVAVITEWPVLCLCAFKQLLTHSLTEDGFLRVMVCYISVKVAEGSASRIDLLELAKISGFSPKVQKYIQQAIEGIHMCVFIQIF